MGRCFSKETLSSIQAVLVSYPSNEDDSSDGDQLERERGDIHTQYSPKSEDSFTSSESSDGERGDLEDTGSCTHSDEVVLSAILRRLSPAPKKSSRFRKSSAFVESRASFSEQLVLGRGDILHVVNRLARFVGGSLYPYHVLSELDDPEWGFLVHFLGCYPGVRLHFMHKLNAAVKDVEDDRLRWKRSTSVLRQWQRLLPKIYEELKAKEVYSLIPPN